MVCGNCLSKVPTAQIPSCPRCGVLVCTCNLKQKNHRCPSTKNSATKEK